MTTQNGAESDSGAFTCIFKLSADTERGAPGPLAAPLRCGSADEYLAAIRDLFIGAESLKIEGRVLPVQRVRASGIGRALSLADKLAVWCETTDSREATERLTERLIRLQSMETDAIVARAVEGDALETRLAA